MNIAIFGFYNSLNAGDDRIQYCLTRALRQNNTLVFLPHFQKPNPVYLRSFDWILIGGGGLVLERVGIWDRMARWIGQSRRKLRGPKVKIGVLGLGVKKVSDGLDRELSDLIERAEFFHVRDSASKSKLNDDPRVEVSPDLTWMFPYHTEIAPQPGIIALNLAPCPWRGFQAAEWVKHLNDEEVKPLPLYFTQDRDYGMLREFYDAVVPDEWTIEPLVQSEILVASRYHAITFAMQLRRPFVAIRYDTKVEGLLADAGLLDCMLQTNQSDQLPEKIAWVRANKAELIARIDRYATEQERQGTQFLEFIRAQVR